MNQPPGPVRRGEKITARRENEVREYSRSNRVSAGPGDRVTVDRFGTHIERAAFADGTACKIKAGSGGIPARVGITAGKATSVVRQVWSGDTLVAADTITVYNISSSAVGADRYGFAVLDDEGRWVVVVESCS